MPIISLFHHFRFQDVLDIIFLSVFAYHLYIWFYETKAFKALVGLLGLGIIYSIAQFWGLFLTTWVFQIFWQVLIILLIILFQPEIRQVLERVNPFYALGWRKPVGHVPWIEGFCKAVFELASKKTGALILFERNDRLEEFITGGTRLETDPTQDMLISIFNKHSPLHDGAVLIRNGRITMASSFLPLTSQEGLARTWGTRHRSAIGITERCDAWALVVSEERGQVSLARDGVLAPMESPELLAEALKTLLTPTNPTSTGLLQKIKFWLLNRWRLKLATIAVVSMVWFSFAGQQIVEATLQIPVEIHNLPPQLVVDEETHRTAVTTRGLRKDIAILNPKNVTMKLDLSGAEVGGKTYYLNRQLLSLPNDRIQVIRIDPNNIRMEISALTN